MGLAPEEKPLGQTEEVYPGDLYLGDLYPGVQKEYEGEEGFNGLWGAEACFGAWVGVAPWPDAWPYCEGEWLDSAAFLGANGLGAEGWPPSNFGWDWDFNADLTEGANCPASWRSAKRWFRLGRQHFHVPRKVNLGDRFRDRGVPDRVTTLMVRNVPNRYDRATLMLELDELGFEGTYNFLYLPIDSWTGYNVGYAFVNFDEPKDAFHCMKVVDGYEFKRHRLWKKRLAVVSVAHIQGLEQNLAHCSGTSLFSACTPWLRPWIRRPSKSSDSQATDEEQEAEEEGGEPEEGDSQKPRQDDVELSIEPSAQALADVQSAEQRDGEQEVQSNTEGTQAISLPVQGPAEVSAQGCNQAQGLVQTQVQAQDDEGQGKAQAEAQTEAPAEVQGVAVNLGQGQGRAQSQVQALAQTRAQVQTQAQAQGQVSAQAKPQAHAEARSQVELEAKVDSESDEEEEADEAEALRGLTLAELEAQAKSGSAPNAVAGGQSSLPAAPRSSRGGAKHRRRGGRWRRCVASPFASSCDVLGQTCEGLASMRCTGPLQGPTSGLEGALPSDSVAHENWTLDALERELMEEPPVQTEQGMMPVEQASLATASGLCFMTAEDWLAESHQSCWAPELQADIGEQEQVNALLGLLGCAGSAAPLPGHGTPIRSASSSDITAEGPGVHVPWAPLSRTVSRTPSPSPEPRPWRHYVENSFCPQHRGPPYVAAECGGLVLQPPPCRWVSAFSRSASPQVSPGCSPRELWGSGEPCSFP
mmetsp:Transcript_33357/g.72874  ORF Transcript_33357/g.72874 Transcript_33357/m.72874 type:complete len:755 (-) Transcript_33357:27-2291(-)